MNDREMIEARCNEEGLTVNGWSETDDGETAALGEYVVVLPGYDDDGLYEGDKGTLSACVVGAEKYGNRRVCFSFTPDGYDEGFEVRDLSALDQR